MTTLHALRRSRKLSLSQLAELTGIPARRLAEYEYEERPLRWKEREALAVVFDVSVLQITAGIDVATAAEPATLQPQQAYLVGALAATAALSLSLRLAAPSLPYSVSSVPIAQSRLAPATASAPSPTPEPPRVTAAAPAAMPAATRAGQTAQNQPATQAAPAAAIPTATMYPTATPPPTRTPEPAQPHRCPVVPPRGHVVVTQGYGDGTNVPAALHGAIDLAVDADGNGLAEPGTTRGATVVAAHAGTVKVSLNSWPEGNHVWVEGSDGWRSGYAHLQTVVVQTGDVVTSGQPLGAVGNTGRAGGPHLDIQVWHEGRNVDPTGLLDCR